MKYKKASIHLIFLFGWCLLLGRVVDLQLMPQPKLEARIKRQFTREITVPSRRGDIYDRNGKLLATSVMTPSLFADPLLITNKKKLAHELASILKKKHSSLYRKLNRKNRFVWIKRKLSDEEFKKIKKLKEKGISFVEEYKRVYPNKESLSSVLGFTDIDGNGLEGLELKYDKELKGKPRKLRVLRDGKGRPLIYSNKRLIKKNRGSDVHLNIDIETQAYFEKTLQESMENSQAKRAWGILMKSDTGEIVSSVQLPGYDSNRARRVNSHLRKNFLASEVHEMGSVIKTFSFLAALEKLGLSPTHKVKCHVKGFPIGRRRIRDSHEEKCDRISIIDAFAQSLNTVSSELALRLGEKRLLRFYKLLGLHKKTGVDFPGEVSPLFYNKLSGRHHLASLSFGHGMSLNSYQVAKAYGALANGGYLVTPHYLKRVQKGLKKTNYKLDASRRVLTKEQSFMGRMLLSSVVKEGATATKAAVPGYLVGGKTGTAQKVDLIKGGYSKDVLSSFAGVFPLSKPEYVMFVVVDSPKSPRSGGAVAAPVFSKVANFVLQKERTAPDDILPDKIRPLGALTYAFDNMKKTLYEGKLKEVPQLKGFSLREVLSQVKKSDIKFLFEGSGKVKKTVPKAGDPVPKSGVVKVVLE